MIGREKYEKGYVLSSGYSFKNNKSPHNATGKFHVVSKRNANDVAAILSFKKGRLDGDCKFFENGQLKEKITYKNNAINGWAIIYEHGIEKERFFYKDGIRQNQQQNQPSYSSTNQVVDSNDTMSFPVPEGLSLPGNYDDKAYPLELVIEEDKPNSTSDSPLPNTIIYNLPSNPIEHSILSVPDLSVNQSTSTYSEQPSVSTTGLSTTQPLATLGTTIVQPPITNTSPDQSGISLLNPSGQYPQPQPGTYISTPGQYPQPQPGTYISTPGQYPQPQPGTYISTPGQYPQPQPGTCISTPGQYPHRQSVTYMNSAGQIVSQVITVPINSGYAINNPSPINSLPIANVIPDQPLDLSQLVTIDPKPVTIDPKPVTIDPKPVIIDPKPDIKPLPLTKDNAKKMRILWSVTGIIILIFVLIFCYLFYYFAEVNVVIKDKSEFSNIDWRAVSITIESYTLNDQDLTRFEITGYSRLKTITVKDNACMYMNSFRLVNLPELKTVNVGMNSFTRSKSSSGQGNGRYILLENCPSLNSFTTQSYAFSTYGIFIARSLPSLETITFGMYALDFLEELTIEDLPNLQSLIFGFDACEGTCHSSKLTLKDLPLLATVSSDGLTFNCVTTVYLENIPRLTRVALPEAFENVEQKTVINASLLESLLR